MLSLNSAPLANWKLSAMTNATKANNGVQTPGDHRDAGRDLAKRHQPREDRRVRQRDAFEIRMAPRPGRHRLRPARELPRQLRAVGEPADLPDPFEEEEDPDRDPQHREAGALVDRSPCVVLRPLKRLRRALQRADDDRGLLCGARIVPRVDRFADARNRLHAVPGIEARRVDDVPIPRTIGQARRARSDRARPSSAAG